MQTLCVNVIKVWPLIIDDMNCLIYKVLQDPSWQSGYFELALTDKNTQVRFLPCPFTGPKMLCAGPNFLSQPKNLNVLVPAQKTILLNANHLFKLFIGH